MKQRVKEMEAEAAKLREMQAQAEKDMNMVEEGTDDVIPDLPFGDFFLMYVPEHGNSPIALLYWHSTIHK